jgi:hypothetical protein
VKSPKNQVQIQEMERPNQLNPNMVITPPSMASVKSKIQSPSAYLSTTNKQHEAVKDGEKPSGTIMAGNSVFNSAK